SFRSIWNAQRRIVGRARYGPRVRPAPPPPPPPEIPLHEDERGAEVRTPEDAAAPPALDRALALVRFLRAHCPWDAAQTPESLVPYLLEEAHETVDAIADGDPSALEGELGDLLLNLAFQVVLGEERGHFDAASV